VFKKEALVRMPIRLGDDAFTGKPIPAWKVASLANTVIGFKHLIDAYGALDFAACATSAMRDAPNGPEVVAAIRARSGVTVDIIDGRREAEVIFQPNGDGAPWATEACVYVDVGGGSTEVTLFDGRESVQSRSFNIGTIRVLKNLVAPGQWDEMKAWLKAVTAQLRPTVSIGSGGNINKVFRLARQKENKPISYKTIKAIREDLASYTLEERVIHLRLRPDRADVIVPAADIFLAVMKWSGVSQMYVPQIGLSDGIVRLLYNRYIENHPNSPAAPAV
jgi:exopolyphosphatase/guanosine-5'-triphosphate,3'-diphosphate pyrophosphatase